MSRDRCERCPELRHLDGATGIAVDSRVPLLEQPSVDSFLVPCHPSQGEPLFAADLQSSRLTQSERVDGDGHPHAAEDLRHTRGG
jgi:hypothetical protein